MEKAKDIITKVSKMLHDYYIPEYGISLNVNVSQELLEQIDTVQKELKGTNNSTTDKVFDIVQNPQHYNGNKYQCIDIMLDTYNKDAVASFCKLNAFKYLYRTEKKNGLEDIKKAVWYLNKYIELNSKDNE